MVTIESPKSRQEVIEGWGQWLWMYWVLTEFQILDTYEQMMIDNAFFTDFYRLIQDPCLFHWLKNRAN